MERLLTVKFLQHLMVSSARSDLPCGMPKGDAWLAHESDYSRYMDFQSEKSLFRIKNADIQCGRIANPTERVIRQLGIYASPYLYNGHYN